MARSKIVINGVTGSYYEGAVGDVIRLANDNSGDESSILWALATGSQPSGSYDGLTNPITFTTYLTASKEGNYLIQNVVDIYIAVLLGQ